MHRNRWVATAFSLALVASLWACGGTTNTEVSVSISPVAVTLEPGDAQVFVASVVGASDASVAWEATGGTVEGSGATVTYTAPLADGAYELTATSNTDNTARSVAHITVAATAIDDATESIDQTGGVLVVDSGAIVDVPPGGMDGEGDFRVRTYDRSRAYDGTTVEPISLAVSVDVPVASLALGDEDALFYIGVPATDLTAEATVALVSIDIGSARYEFAANYHPTTENAIAIYIAQLRVLFESHGSVPTTIRINVQAVAVEPDGFAGLAVQMRSTRAAGLYQLMPNADLERARTICGSNDEASSWAGFIRITGAAAVPTGKVPLVLIHGTQEVGMLKDTFTLSRKSRYHPALCAWLDFMAYFEGEGELTTRYEIYSFGYDSRGSVASNANRFRSAIEQAFGDRPVVVLAHSMGGMVADHVIQSAPSTIHHLVTLGTPFRGTRALLCEESDGVRCTRARALAGLSAFPFAAVDPGQGTLDLAWEFGGVFYSRNFICHDDDGFFTFRVCSPQSESVDNAYLVAANADLATARRANYHALYGHILGFGKLKENVLTTTTGLQNDGIVPTQSACLSRSTGIDNACTESTFGNRRLSFALDHHELKNDGGTFASLRLLLRNAWPAPPTPDVTVSVAPTTATLEPGATQSFTATVGNADDTRVTWSVTCGSVSGSGAMVTYTAPASVPTGGSCLVRATSVEAAGTWAQAVVTIEPDASDPPPTVSSTAVAGSTVHSLALLTDGTVWAWGRNSFGELGDGTTTDRRTPVQVSGLTEVASIAAGQIHSLALRTDGTVWAWGVNSYGQLGDGSTTDRRTPVQVSGLTEVARIAAGHLHSLALRTDGTVWAWGENDHGQLGDGSTTDRFTPVQVSGLTEVASIAAGLDHSLALRTDGSVWAWGGNVSGQLGSGASGDRLTPVQVTGLGNVTSITAGGWHSLALDADGFVWAWGANWYGELGDGTTTDRRTPVQVSDLSNVASIATGSWHSLALRTDGSVWAWGSNEFGQLGDGTTTDHVTPVQVGDLSNVASIATGSRHSLAMRADGSVWAWGDNRYGQLGDGTTIDRLTPVRVSGF